jgi:hypothetical protein
VPSHAVAGTAREARSVDDDDSNVHAPGKLAQRPLDDLLWGPPALKLGIGPIGQQRPNDMLAITCRSDGSLLTGK